MLSRELHPLTAPDPRYVPLSPHPSSLVSPNWYFDPDTGTLRLEEDLQYALPTGGVLCEEMGSGKTLMCLALVVATRGKVVGPRREGGGEGVVLTQGAVDEIPWGPYAGYRKPILGESGKEVEREVEVPTLKQLAYQATLTSPLGPSLSAVFLPTRSSEPTSMRMAEKRAFIDSLPSLRSNLYPSLGAGGARPFYYDTNHLGAIWGRETRGAARLDRSISESGGEQGWRTVKESDKVWLSSLSLIVVPEVLNGQWVNEIMKHVEDGVLRVLRVGEEGLPTAEEMVDEYDSTLR